MSKTNPELHGFSMEPIVDMHCHIRFEKHIGETVENYKKIIKHFNYRNICLNAIPVSHSSTENYQAIYCKSKLQPFVYASAGLEYYLDERDTPDEMLRQIKIYHSMGFDGMKMLDGKISQYRLTKYKLNDPLFDKFYEYAEANEIPILLHVADPIEFWDISKATPYTIEKGWVYGESDPSQAELQGWVLDILSRFPNLKLILAHFFFMSSNLNKLAELLDTYKNVYIDTTPGGEMFSNFKQNYDNAREFFVKYQDRILYGSDMYNIFADVEKAEKEIAGPRVFAVRSMLEKREELKSAVGTIKPFGLEKEILDKIYFENFYKVYGREPKAIEPKKVAVGCNDFVGKTQNLNKVEKENIELILRHFESFC